MTCCFSSTAVSALPLAGSWSGKARMLWGYVASRETLPTSPRLQLPTVCTVSCSRGSLESAGQQLPPVSVIAWLKWRDVPADPCTAHAWARWFCDFAGFVKHSPTVNPSDERLDLCNSISNLFKLYIRCSRWCFLIVDLCFNSSSYYQTFDTAHALCVCSRWAETLLMSVL